MTCFRLSRGIALTVSGLIVLIISLACGLPIRSYITLQGEANQEVEVNESRTGDIPSRVLTDVAATLFAPQQATFTAPAIEERVTTDPAQGVTTPRPTIERTQPGSKNIPVATAYQPDTPPSSFTAQTGKDISISGMNIHNCDGINTVNFLVENTGTQALESLSLQFIDLSTDKDLSEPSISNAPFSQSDRACKPGGISSIDPGRWLFVGGLIGFDQISGHTILANFLFCTQEDLVGQCYPRSVEFIMP